MPTAYDFGTINIDGASYTLKACAITGGRRVGQIAYPRQDKGRSIDGRSKAKSFQCAISVRGTSVATYQANLRALIAALNTGAEMTLYFYDTTRHYHVMVSDISDPIPDDTRFRSVVTFTATAADPFWHHDSTPNSPNTKTPDANTYNWTITTQGNAHVEPVITITGAFSALTLTNNTTGEHLDYAAALGAGAVLEIDVANRTVKLDTVSAFTNFSGDVDSAGFITLAAGANSMTLTTTSQGGTVVTTWTDCDWGGH